jgi:hypothetical protein
MKWWGIELRKLRSEARMRSRRASLVLGQLRRSEGGREGWGGDGDDRWK